MTIKRRSEKQNDKQLVLKIKPFLKLLKRIYLGGTIDECVLEFKNKKCNVGVFDLTNTVIVFVDENVLKNNSEKMKFGFDSIDVLIKFLSTIPDTQLFMETKNNKIIFKRKDSKRSLTCMVKDPEVVPTRLEKRNSRDDPKQVYLDMQEYSVPLNQIFVKDFLSYLSSLKTKHHTKYVSSEKVCIKYNKKEGVKFICGGKNENQLEIVLDGEIKKINEDADDKISLSVNGDFLSKVFKELDFEDDSMPLLYFANKSPIAIQSQDTLWAIKPLMDDKHE
ncbi:MAG: hypothetical protein ACE5RH_02990 [Nitrosarchaeum sp.]